MHVEIMTPSEPAADEMTVVNVVADGATGTLSQIGSPKCRFVEESLEDAEKSTYTVQQVADHKSSSNLWIIIDNDIYDVTAFQNEHPGGHKGEQGPIAHLGCLLSVKVWSANLSMPQYSLELPARTPRRSLTSIIDEGFWRSTRKT
jgi:hypothetical protein